MKICGQKSAISQNLELAAEPRSNMKSPITGKEMTLQKEMRPILFRKEEFTVAYHYYLCKDSGQQFTTTELDERNLAQAYNQYRARHHLPFAEEVRAIREMYGLSATKMSEILGFGVNSYRQYEQGEIPSEANGRLIQLAGNPSQFRNLLDLCSNLEDDAKQKLMHTVDQLIDRQRMAVPSRYVEDMLVGPIQADEFSGFRKPKMERLANMIAYFARVLEPYKTKMNKLLFYADFAHFKKTGQSISGMRYYAIQMGPVPHNYNSIYERLVEQGQISVRTSVMENEAIAEKFLGGSLNPLHTNVLTDDERTTLSEVSKRFEHITGKGLAELSHQEQGWIENHDQNTKPISYLKYAFDLKAI
jgi:putative zinc finger/helix-turn-helix YgiT family protein